MGGRDYHDIEHDSDHEVAVEEESGGPSAVLRRCNAVSIVITIIGVLVGLLIILLVTLALLASFDVIDFQKDLSDDDSFYTQISADDIMLHLTQFEAISKQYNDSRSIDLGYNASLQYVKTVLQSSTNFNVYEQQFSLQTPVTKIPQLSQEAPFPEVYSYPADVAPMTYSGSGDVTGPVFLAANFGCAPEDYADFSPPPGGAPVVVLVGRGGCSFREKVLNATAWANASAVVLHNSEGLDGPIFGTLGGVLPQPIPVVSVTYGLAQTLIATQNLPLALSAAPNASQWLVVELRVVSESSIKTSWTANLFAETPDGDDTRVLVQGSHLDSVPAGPGINDNGSGSATNLQIALMFYRAKLKPRNKVRFAWWAAEELGLLGSAYYVSSLSEQDKSKIALNLNYDMLGSPNFYRGVLNGYEADEAIRPACSKITDLYKEFFDAHHIPYKLGSFTGRSDYGSFLAAGIPAGGLQTGAEVLKIDEYRQDFGGWANTAYDPCYHKYCDTVENINKPCLADMAQAAAYVLQKLAMQSELPKFLNSTSS